MNIKTYNSFSSEKSKCVVCGKVSNDYIKYNNNGIEISISKHIECHINEFILDDIKVAIQIIKNKIVKGV